MALSRRSSQRMNGAIWPGFVDAMTALLLVLMFVLSIFMIVQSVLRETIDSQDHELDNLTAQVAGLADALGLARGRADDLEQDVGRLNETLSEAQAEGAAQAALIASLSGQLSARQKDLEFATARIASFESQVASLLVDRDAALGEAATLAATVSDLEAAQTRLLTEQEALNLSIARAREEVDAQSETARLAAARSDALDALVADLRSKLAEGEATLSDALARLTQAEGQAGALSAATTQISGLEAELTETERALLAERAAAEVLRVRLAGLQTELSDEEKARLADIAAAEALRARLAASENELTAMTLALEEQRKRAEETLTLLAAAQTTAAGALTEKEALLATAQAALTQEQAQSAENARRMALLNEQVAALRGQLGNLQGLLDASSARDEAATVRLDEMGTQLNTALARVAEEQKKRAELEEAERIRLEAETKKLENFRSEFFGQMREVLAGRDGVRIVGDRFVFSSEVLFEQGSADLAGEGRRQIAGVVASLREISDLIPAGIDWVIRVDGHTDNVPLSGLGEFADNWELSQARALSVVRFMQNDLGFPPGRMAATGFGEWQPVAQGDSEAARAQNRRIELKLTER
ncbi:peptidoglycan -binding protein [Pseudorhodobacter turbinis]|uniref:Peptidoglycan-binding protein n=1 Tax=Pseudorhodobacter turbinis TaxID=2500533 RepID=A0A4P8EIB2_9RHOB|nr:peptidoglycan -binding protein [Pseudorhodobacter turbinis]QCO56375.1 peptidoglycan -binding protein [Pseudorhodobacter turbinis]